MILKSKIVSVACSLPVCSSFIFIFVAFQLFLKNTGRKQIHFAINFRFLCLGAHAFITEFASSAEVGWEFYMVRNIYTDLTLLCLSSMTVKLLCSALLAFNLRICRIITPFFFYYYLLYLFLFPQLQTLQIAISRFQHWLSDYSTSKHLGQVSADNLSE